jgi:hypothetical protein
LPDRPFVWAYAGDIGLAHGLEFAADAVGILGRDTCCWWWARARGRTALEERIADQAAGRVKLQELMSPADAARRIRAADAVLVSERQERTVSAKLHDVCAMGGPSSLPVAVS